MGSSWIKRLFITCLHKSCLFCMCKQNHDIPQTKTSIRKTMKGKLREINQKCNRANTDASIRCKQLLI